MAEAVAPANPRPHAVADGIWIVDSRPIKVAGGMPLPIRMTVIRISNGDLLLHSPTQYLDDLKSAIEALGPIRHLIAPSVGHWMFLRDWQRACPAAKTWAVPGLKDRAQVRKAGIRIDAELGDDAPAPWSGEIDQVLVRAPVFKEVDFFHRASRTLLLTDLILNVEPEDLPPFFRLMARALGILAPDGKAPAYVRALLKLNRGETARAAARLVAFDPERVIFAHGSWFERDGAQRLRRSLSWLLKA
ncbi:MAG: DUF4336 domain-containing protein [Methylobacteriaceae bacterium]|nr:DUF4336 domain-containing protein [Methylobacteriaceae bacterium]